MVEEGSIKCRRCWGRNVNLHRCLRNLERGFLCNDHKYQPLILLVFLFCTLGTAVITYKTFFTQNIQFIQDYSYHFPEVSKISEIWKRDNPTDKPNKSDAQSIYLGYEEKFSGIDFESSNPGEIFLVGDGKRISLGSFSGMDPGVVRNKAVIRSLNINESNGVLVFSGQIDIEGDSPSHADIIIGSGEFESILDFQTTIDRKVVYAEKSNWLSFLGLQSNPMINDDKFKWYHYFISKGYRVTINAGQELSFSFKKRIQDTNTFTITLPLQ